MAVLNATTVRLPTGIITSLLLMRVVVVADPFSYWGATLLELWVIDTCGDSFPGSSWALRLACPSLFVMGVVLATVACDPLQRSVGSPSELGSARGRRFSGSCWVIRVASLIDTEP